MITPGTVCTRSASRLASRSCRLVARCTSRSSPQRTVSELDVLYLRVGEEQRLTIQNHGGKKRHVRTPPSTRFRNPLTMNPVAHVCGAARSGVAYRFPARDVRATRKHTNELAAPREDQRNVAVPPLNSSELRRAAFTSDSKAHRLAPRSNDFIISLASRKRDLFVRQLRVAHRSSSSTVPREEG